MTDETVTDTRPLLELERNGDHLFIGVTEFDSEGYGVRSYVLSSGRGGIADSVMERRYADMVRLMGDNVRTKP